MFEKFLLILSIEGILYLVYAFGLIMEERSRRRKLRRKKSKQRLARSIECAGRRLMIEDRIKSILKEPVKVETVKPIREVKRDSKTCFGKSNLCIACGVLVSEEAQRILER